MESKVLLKNLKFHGTMNIHVNSGTVWMQNCKISQSVSVYMETPNKPTIYAKDCLFDSKIGLICKSGSAFIAGCTFKHSSRYIFALSSRAYLRLIGCIFKNNIEFVRQYDYPCILSDKCVMKGNIFEGYNGNSQETECLLTKNIMLL